MAGMTRLSFDNFWAIPRLGSLTLSPDGRRLVLGVQTLGPDSTKFVSSLWELPADGSAPARRLTYSEKGEGAHAFLPDGSLVFASARPDVTLKEDEADARVFLLPQDGGEARPLLSVPGGVDAIVAARSAPVAVLKCDLFPGSADLTADAAKAKARKEAGAAGMLFDGFPIRFWDHDLGPRQARLLRIEIREGRPDVADLTPDAGGALMEAAYDVSPDGASCVTGWWRNEAGLELASDLVLVRDGASKAVARGGGDYEGPAVSPDGRFAVASRASIATRHDPSEVTLWLVDLENGEGRDLTPSFPQWPAGARWAADGRSIWFVAEESGRAPVFNVDLASGEVRRVAADGAFSSLCPAPDGSVVFALRATWSSPPEVVRIDAASGEVTALPTPGLPLEVPGRLEELVARSADGVEIRSWLVLPDGASAERPAPLLLWIHGGPWSSWSGWSWRWCPHLMAERGYAVLMPDPALSTGYGTDFIRRAHGRWGDAVWADLECSLDAALRRPDLDGERTAAMGGSFGGYMSNWVAGHVDRFKAIVTHASLWDLEQFVGTTDTPHWWEREFGPPATGAAYGTVSPSSTLEGIKTPMLVIHGLRDYRVPISEGLRLYTDLRRRGVPARFLYFPDENHWVLKPGNSRLWYETVFAFLAEHVLGEEWRRPELI